MLFVTGDLRDANVTDLMPDNADRFLFAALLRGNTTICTLIIKNDERITATRMVLANRIDNQKGRKTTCRQHN